MPLRLVSRCWFPSFYLCFDPILGQKISFDSYCSWLKQGQLLVFITMKKASMFVGKRQLPLNSPSISLELRGQKKRRAHGWLPQVGGSFTFGWLSAGILELQLVAKVESLTNRNIRRSGFYMFLQLLRTIFCKYLGLKIGVIF